MHKCFACTHTYVYAPGKEMGIVSFGVTGGFELLSGSNLYRSNKCQPLSHPSICYGIHLLILALGGWRQEDQKLKVILRYTSIKTNLGHVGHPLRKRKGWMDGRREGRKAFCLGCVCMRDLGFMWGLVGFEIGSHCVVQLPSLRDPLPLLLSERWNSNCLFFNRN